MFRIKWNPNGSIAWYKAHLLEKGFHQHLSLDYHKTFNLVIKPTIIWIVLSIILSREWPMHQLDVNNAFLHGHVHEEIFMSQPLTLLISFSLIMLLVCWIFSVVMMMNEWSVPSFLGVCVPYEYTCMYK